MLCFGEMILGDYDQVTTVARALDIEEKHRQKELTESVDNRHPIRSIISAIRFPKLWGS